MFLLLQRWPKIIPKGVETNAQITSPDFYPTILDCCNIPQDPDQHKDGKSFFDILSNPSKPHKRGPIFWHYPHYNGNGAHPGSIVIDGKWKLIEWHEDGNLELYNLEEDIGETNNLANQELDVVKDLYNLLQNWKQEVDAIMPRPNPNYNLILAKVKIHATGKLLRDDRNQVILKTQLFKRNPQIFDVPIQELIQEILNKTLLLKIGEYLRTGRFLVSDKTDVFLFEDIHEENRIPFSSLAEDYIGEEIELRAWDEIPEDPENQDEKPLPQVELKLKPDLV